MPMDEYKTLILNLNDSEFISFLYSERDRENSLSQYQGWNNWALAGAIIAILCFVYATIKDAGQIDSMQCIYYATGSIAFFLAYHTCYHFLKGSGGTILPVSGCLGKRLLGQCSPRNHNVHNCNRPDSCI